MAHIPYPDLDAAPAELAHLLGNMPRHAPIDMLAHSPALAASFLRLAQAQFTGLELPVRSREVLILTVAVSTECEYEYVQHIAMSEAAGVDPGTREALRRGEFDAPAISADDRLIVSLVRETVASPRLSDALMAELRIRHSPRQIVEMLQLVGFYWSLARFCTVLNIEIDEAKDLTSIDAVSNLPDQRG
jgi:alkylhydroperoxidase family enzyme